MVSGRAVLEMVAEGRAKGLSAYQAADLAAHAILADIQQQPHQQPPPDLPRATAVAATAEEKERQRAAHSRSEQLKNHYAQLRAARGNRCKRGHEQTPENVRVVTRGHRVSRVCKVCIRESDQRSQAQSRAIG